MSPEATPPPDDTENDDTGDKPDYEVNYQPIPKNLDQKLNLHRWFGVEPVSITYKTDIPPADYRLPKTKYFGSGASHTGEGKKEVKPLPPLKPEPARKELVIEVNGRKFPWVVVEDQSTPRLWDYLCKLAQWGAKGFRDSEELTLDDPQDRKYTGPLNRASYLDLISHKIIIVGNPLPRGVLTFEISNPDSNTGDERVMYIKREQYIRRKLEGDLGPHELIDHPLRIDPSLNYEFTFMVLAEELGIPAPKVMEVATRKIHEDLGRIFQLGMSVLPGKTMRDVLTDLRQAELSEDEKKEKLVEITEQFGAMFPFLRIMGIRDHHYWNYLYDEETGKLGRIDAMEHFVALPYDQVTGYEEPVRGNMIGFLLQSWFEVLKPEWINREGLVHSMNVPRKDEQERQEIFETLMNSFRTGIYKGLEDMTMKRGQLLQISKELENLFPIVDPLIWKRLNHGLEDVNQEKLEELVAGEQQKVNEYFDNYHN
jgi:hypothetical protein